MAGSSLKMVVDDKELSMFLTSVKRDEKKALRRAYSAAIRPVITTARQGARKHVGRKLAKAVRGGAWKKGGGASAYIRGPQDYRAVGADYDNFKLLFFEGGTKTRYNLRRNGRRLRKKASRGKILGRFFFQSAVSAKSALGVQAFEESLRKWIMAKEPQKH